MGFMREDTGDEMSFIAGAIQSFFTCCIGVSCEGTDMEMILLVGNGFSMMTSWTEGDGILTSMTLYRP